MKLSIQRGTFFGILLGLGAVFLLGGCAKTYNMTVDSIVHPEKTAGYSYRIVSADPRLDHEDLRYQEAVEYVKTALSGRGMYESASIESAEMLIEVDYGIEPPRTKFETTSNPIYVTQPGRVRTTTVPVVGRNGQVSYQTITVYDPPTRELAGFEESVRPVVVYEKYLRITARENQISYDDDNPPAQLWSVHVTNEDESNDLRGYLPIMASASIDYIGRNTGSQEVVKIKEGSDEVLFVKTGM